MAYNSFLSDAEVAAKIKCGYEVSSCKYLKTGEIDPKSLTVSSKNAECLNNYVLFTSKKNHVCCQYVVQTEILDLAISNNTEAFINYKTILEEIRDKSDVIQDEMILDIIAKIKNDFAERFL